jgi:hypothetical protein
MFIGTTLSKALLKISTMLTITMLFHFVQLCYLQIFTPFGDFALFRPQGVKILRTSGEKGKLSKKQASDHTSWQQQGVRTYVDNSTQKKIFLAIPLSQRKY